MNPTDPMMKVEPREFWIAECTLKHEEVVCLEEEYTKNFPDLDFIHVIEMQAFTEALEQIDKLKHALEFYADTKNLAPLSVRGVYQPISSVARAAIDDLEAWVRR